MSGLFTKVLKLPSQFPLLRGMVSYAIIWPTCSIVQEYLEHGTRIEAADYTRAARFGIFGAFFMAPVYYSWIKYTSRFFKGKSLKTAMTRAAIEQLGYSPLALAYFYFGMSLLEMKPLKSCVNEVREKFWPTYKIGVIFWPTAQTLNFYFISEKNRMVFVSAASFVWTVYLAHMKGNTHDKDSQNMGLSKVSADSLLEKTGLSITLHDSSAKKEGLINTKAKTRVEKANISNISTDFNAKESNLANVALESNANKAKLSNILVNPNVNVVRSSKISTWTLKDGKIIVSDSTPNETKLINIPVDQKVEEATLDNVVVDPKLNETDQSVNNDRIGKRSNLSNVINTGDHEPKQINTSSASKVIELATISIPAADKKSKVSQKSDSIIKEADFDKMPKLNEAEINKASGDFKDDSLSSDALDCNKEGDMNHVQPDLGVCAKEETQCFKETPCFQETPCLQATPCFQDKPCVQDNPCVQEKPCSQEEPCGQDKPCVQT